MQIHRLLEMVYILLAKRRITANQLAIHFEVSKRTILRDVDTLAMAGIPIYTAKGRGGGIFLLDNFILNKATISVEERHHILMALHSIASQVNVSQILTKLNFFFEQHDTPWIEVDFSCWGRDKENKDKFDQLKTAIINKQVITFNYPTLTGQLTPRTVYPLKLVFKSSAWYIQSYCLLKQNYRTFKIRRILQLMVLPERFSDQQFSPPPLTFEDSMPYQQIELKLWFSANMAYRIYDEFDMKSVLKNEDGSFIVTLPLPDDDWLYSFLLSFGSAVKVLTPQKVKDNLLFQLAAIQKVYMDR